MQNGSPPGAVAGERAHLHYACGETDPAERLFACHLERGAQSWARPVHFDEARHTAASPMLAMGTKLEIVSRVLGHSSVTVTADVYSHLLGGKSGQALRR